MDPTALLERHWGYREFRPLQQEAIASIRDGRDSLVVLPTGGGKSLCFQLPAFAHDDGIGVVVSPLIALMKDQVDSLVGLGLPAAYYNSSLTAHQQSIVRDRLRQGRYRLVYVSPERLAAGGGFVEILRSCGVRFVAVDEAHCISQWGHDFRPEYRQLGELRQVFPGVSVHAFTATATHRVRRDIVEQLRLEDPELLVGSFDRPNLVYRALRRQNAYTQVKAVVDGHAGEAGIVYCISRKAVENLATRLQDDGVRALPYHAGLDDDTRKRHQDAFIQERADVVVATVAFGMGIDRSDVRFVVHAQAPRSLEHYQQEAGRAGRDGLEAECLLVHSPSDFITWRRMLDSAGELTPEAEAHLREMERFALATRCRHRRLAEYFGETYERDGCDACDWCLGELEMAEEPVVLAQKILSCVLRLRQSWGVGQVVDVLRGRLTEKVKSRRHDQLSTFGLLEDMPVAELRGYVDQLADQGFLELTGDRFPIVQVTPEGRRLLKAEAECALFRHKVPPKKVKAPKAAPAGLGWEGVDRELFERLRELRLELARERGVPPYVIFHDTSLRDIARRRPGSVEELLACHGVGEKKAADWGERIVAVVGEAEPSPPARD